MKIHKLTSTDGFIAFDLADAESSTGVTRLAPKILQDGAKLLARSTTYAFATFGLRRGGASAGINAKPDARDDAVRAFVEEVGPMVADGRWTTDPGLGLDEADLAPLRADDPRPRALWEEGLAAELEAMGAVAAATAFGDLDGKRVVIDGLSGPELVRALASCGATVLGVTTPAGATFSTDGLASQSLADGWAEHGAAIVGQLGTASVDRAQVLGLPCDVLFAGTKPGSIDHEVAAGIEASLVVPSAPVPVTTKALATFGRQGAVVVPDFVSTAATLLAGHDLDGGDPVERVRTSAAELADEGTNTWMAAALRAETFLRTWQDELPFGRPLA